MDPALVTVFILGLSIGSGAALKRAGPYLFYYVSVPLLSAIGLTWLMDSVNIPHFDCRFDPAMGRQRSVWEGRPPSNTKKSPRGR